MFEGLKMATSVSTAAVFTLTPLLSAGFGWLLLRQRTTLRMAFALARGGAGALWVMFDASLPALLAFDIGRGEAIFFVRCIAHAAYTPMVPKLNRGEAPLSFTFGMIIAGFIILTFYAAPALRATDWTGLPLLFWITLGYLAAFASAATFLLAQLDASKNGAFCRLI